MKERSGRRRVPLGTLAIHFECVSTRERLEMALVLPPPKDMTPESQRIARLPEGHHPLRRTRPRRLQKAILGPSVLPRPRTPRGQRTPSCGPGSSAGMPVTASCAGIPALTMILAGSTSGEVRCRQHPPPPPLSYKCICNWHLVSDIAIKWKRSKTNIFLFDTPLVLTETGSSTVEGLLNFVDQYICTDGAKRIGLETPEEKQFLIDCFLCHPNSGFGGN